MGIVERIKAIELELSRTQLNKATSSHVGLLKSQLARLRSELLLPGPGESNAGGHEGFAVAKNGDGRVALIGFPSVGKSSILSEVTDTKSECAAYEFTTLTCIPGNLVINDTKIQMLDLPGIIEGAAHGKGRGREVIAVARSSDLILMVLDGVKESNNQHRDILTTELETVGIRLNKTPPDIYFRKKQIGGIKFNATVPLTQLGDNPGDMVYRILHNYKIHNAEVLFRQDCSVDELIDVIEGNRKYVKCLYVYNKIDTLSIEEVDALARNPYSVVISVYMKLNIEVMIYKMWEMMGLMRIYTKKKGTEPDLNVPIVVSSQRHGTSVGAACKSISKNLYENFNFALVWGKSVKFSPQRVGLSHPLMDEDVLQIVSKTYVQQKQSRNYREKVDANNAALLKKRKKLRNNKQPIIPSTL